MMEEWKQTVRSIVRQGAFYSSMSGIYSCTKRLLDMVVSMAGLIILFPVFAAMLLYLKRRSSGPVFIKREMAGRNGRSIRVYVFRTAADYEGQNLSGWKKSRVIRRLPMLWSVLKGDMSLIGPLPVSVKDMAGVDAWYVIRLAVKPGIVSLWHIEGRRKDDFAEMVRCDVKYIRERNFLYDLKILLKAVRLLIGI